MDDGAGWVIKAGDFYFPPGHAGSWFGRPSHSSQFQADL
jgi:hypothetical protein